MPQPRAARNSITIALTPVQIAWLDRQAADLDRSRSSFLRTLITAQMKRITE